MSYEPIEYSYLITTGSLATIRETFRENKDFATNESLHKNYISQRVADGEVITPENPKLDLQESLNRNMIFPSNNANVEYDEAEKGLKLTATGQDTGIHVRFDSLGGIPTKVGDTLIIEYMIPTANAGTNYQADVFICAGSYTDAAEACRVRVNLVKDGAYHRLELPVADYNFWTGNLNGFRFDFFDTCAVGDTMYVRAVALE